MIGDSQGWVFGPLLFSLHVSDVNEAAIKTYLHVDDVAYLCDVVALA